MDKASAPLSPHKALGLWLAAESAALFLGSALQAGLWGAIPPAPLHFTAALAESLCGLALALAARAAWAGRAWAPKTAAYTLLLSLAGVLLGIAAAAGRPGAAGGEAFHSILFISLWINVGLLPVEGHQAAS